VGRHCGVLWPQPSSTSQGSQAHRAPRQTLWSLGARKSGALRDLSRCRAAVNMRILYNKRPVGSEPMTNPRILTEPKSTELIHRLAPHWQLRLYDGAVIDHILKVINEPRRSRSHESRQSSPRQSSPHFPGPLPSSGPSSGFGESSSDQVKKPA
jgi:hypothetical protein